MLRVFLFAVLTAPFFGCGKPADPPVASSNGTTVPPAEVAVIGKPKPNEAPMPAEVPPTTPTPQPKPVVRSTEVKKFLEQVGKLGWSEASWGDKQADVVRLSFSGPGLSDDALGKLRPLIVSAPIAVELNLNGSEVLTDAGLAHLKGVETIRGLALTSKKLTAAGMKSIGEITKLETFSLSHDLLTDADLAPLSKLTALRKLSIYGAKLTDAAYVHLATLVNLEEIHVGGIGHSISDECLKHMKGMTKLKELNIGRDKLTDTGMASLSRMTELRSLRIDAPNVTAAGLAHLVPLKKLQKLIVLSGPAFTGKALEALEGMSELTELELIYTAGLDKVGGGHLGKLTALKKLRLGSVQNGGLEGLAGLKNLETLDMSYSLVGDTDMKFVAGMTALKQLDVQHTRVADAGIKHLSGMTKLVSLSTSANAMTDAALASIAGLPSLEALSISECKITGSGFKELTKLTKLKDLWLNGNPVTDEHVLVLKDLPALKEVVLTGTQVSDEVAMALKKARKELRVRDVAGDEVSLDKKQPFTPPKPNQPDISKTEPAFKLTAEAFAKEVETDKAAAEKKYKDKVIELTGVVEGVGRSGIGNSNITLKVENKLVGVMCGMVEDEPWVKVAKGQKVRIKGLWPEFSFAPSLYACVLVDAGDYKAIRLTANDLAKEYAADSEATVKKYENKNLVLTGEVVSKTFNSAGAASLRLKTEGKVKVECSFTAFEKDLVKPMKVGQTVTVFGDFVLNFAGGDSVTLYMCLPLPTPAPKK